ncbi:serine protease snake-like [Chironomus tepperi]|uniref:serine protease snake-like n=1 Tax=Chironomus tepperi TaxID=113505 RepID=UPI00391EFAA7
MKFKILCYFATYFIALNGRKIEYLNGLFEDHFCELENQEPGICKQVTDCNEEYEAYRNDVKTLRICSYSDDPSTSVICCPNVQDKMIISKQRTELDLTDFETCTNEFLMFRRNKINIDHFAKAFSEGIIPKNQENCEFINKDVTDDHFWDDDHPICHNNNGKFELTTVPIVNGQLVRKGDGPNIAAIGWTQEDKSILYNCGGSIINERYIVTAAHCRFIDKKEPDLARLGDRYLFTAEDDEIAQQVRIEKFIIHPDYTQSRYYNDIALIKTVEKIIFNKFVVPSCIADLDEEYKAAHEEKFWTIAGYGETEDRVRSNILLGLRAEFVSYEKCTEFFSDDSTLPRGIIDSQLCAKSIGKVMQENAQYPKTCFGYSGSPLQYKIAVEVFPDDFNKTFISQYYFSSNVIGIVSFGAGCALDGPIVFTKLAYYRDWIRDLIQKN